MKKILLSAAALLLATVSFAGDIKTYTDQLSVSINGIGSSQESTITMEYLNDSTVNFTLKNFMLQNGENIIPVGNIAIDSLALTQVGGLKTFAYNGILNIVPGDPEVSDTWAGPILGDVPLDLKGSTNGEKLYVDIDIDMTATLQQMIKVVFGQEIEDAIAGVKTACAPQAVYDLQGRRVQAAGHGLYIIGGRKVLK